MLSHYQSYQYKILKLQANTSTRTFGNSSNWTRWFRRQFVNRTGDNRKYRK